MIKIVKTMSLSRNKKILNFIFKIFYFRVGKMKEFRGIQVNTGILRR